MNKTLVNQILYLLKQIIGMFSGAGTPGTIIDVVKNKISPKSFGDEVREWFEKNGHPYDSQFCSVLIQNYSNPNTFNDWRLVGINGEWFKWRCTGEAGKWSARQKKKYRIRWCARWIPGHYEKVFAMSRDGATEFQRLGMPALWNCKKVSLFNMDTKKIEDGMNCDEHGRGSTRDWVSVSSAGCIVTKKGRKIYDVVALFKRSYIYHRDTLKAKFDLTVATIDDFPSIKGVHIL